MDTEPAELPPRPLPKAGRGWLMSMALLVSLLINGAIFVVLILIALPAMRPNSPVIEVNFQPPPEEPDRIENQHIQKFARRVDTSGSSAGMVRPVVSAAVSPISMTVPDFVTAGSGNFPGADLGFAPGTGTGNGFGSGMGGNGVRTASIGGIQVKAARLGVVLDVSGSMDDDLPKVRRELRKEFKIASIVEVKGCSLRWSGDPAFDVAGGRGKARFRTRADHVLEAIEMLVAAKRCDAIFWFSDLQDQQQAEAFPRLEHLLGTIEGSGRRPVRFYIRSVQNPPSDLLLEVVERSGGGTR